MIFYVPWLHMHQPYVWVKEKLVSCLEFMLASPDQTTRWNAKLIARAYKNPAKWVLELKEKGFEPRIMLDFSGTLLEGLAELCKRKEFRGIVVNGEKIGNIIRLYKRVMRKYPQCIEMAGTAYSHCYFPMIPPEDWKLQLEEWRKVFKKIFGKKNLERVKGFWLPEMGVPAYEDRLKKLVGVVSEYYEWMILPLQAVRNYERMSYEERIKMVCKPYLLKVKDSSIPVIFRAPTYFIDQQAGCDASLLIEKLLEAQKILGRKKIGLIVPASDGENGNVMMNEFFPKTFIPFFSEKVKKHKGISSLSVSQFLYKFYEKNGEIVLRETVELKTIGASWINGHKFWLEGTRKQEMMGKIYELSRLYHSKSKRVREKAKRLFLIAETSCYVYWGTDFWFQQGEKTIQKVKKMLKEL